MTSREDRHSYVNSATSALNEIVYDNRSDDEEKTIIRYAIEALLGALGADVDSIMFQLSE